MAAAWNNCFTYVLMLCLCCSNIQINCESYSPNEAEDKLGVAYEFKIHVDAGREECFFQNVHMGSSLYVAFQVMRGGDNQAGFAIRNPHGALVLPYVWKSNAEFEENHVQFGGYYQMCIDNSVSRFASKLVSLYVASFKRDEWEKYIQELTDAEVTVANFTSSLANVDQNIGSMLKRLDQSRRSHTADWYLVEGNNRYVQYWSLAQCTVIIICSLVQVYFVRKLFYVRDDVKGKPRA